MESECIAHADHLARALASIRSAIKRKSARDDIESRYSDGHILIISFDDWQWYSSADEDKTCEFIRQTITEIPLHFSTLFLIGLSGNTYLPFEVCGEHNS